MPYIKDKKTLDKLIEKALENTEIVEAANKAKLPSEELVSSLSEKIEKIWGAANKEIEEFNRSERELQNAEKEEAKIIPRRPFSLLILKPLIILLAVSSLFILIVVGSSQALASAAIFIFLDILFIFVDRDYQRRHDKAVKDVLTKFQMPKLRERIEQKREEVEKAVFESILRESRVTINERIAPSFSTQVSELTAPGLSEVYDETYDIDTRAINKLYQLLNNIKGGSIGIAGWRGVGKTTLIRSASRRIPEKEGLPTLLVQTSAPVMYDAREFILHLFSSVCRRILEEAGVIADQSPLSDQAIIAKIQHSTTEPMRKLADVIRSVFLPLGIALTLIGVTLFPGLFAPSYINAVKGLGVQAGTCIFLGITFIAISQGLFKFNRYFEQQERQAREQLGAHFETPLSGVVRNAMEWLREIRFQQSYSSGWSGSISLPTGLQGGVDATISFAQKQKSLPDIVNAYKDFLEEAANEYHIIIGIDELDKMESDEKAQRFLNDIKAIFGVKGCFYLVSVSESAISSFDRRGLPFRDAFDSSFDSIIYVENMNIEESKNLLARRVIGLPVPFVGLCHCMAGGLARDVIRYCREIVEFARLSQGENNLSSLCLSLLKSDIESKVRASYISVREIHLEPARTQFIKGLRALRLDSISFDTLLEDSINLLEKKSEISAKWDDSLQDAESRERLNSIFELIEELGIYLYYSSTVLEFHQKMEAKLRNQDRELDNVAIEGLAEARQSFAFNPINARSIVTMFREKYEKEYQLNVPDFFKEPKAG